MSLFEALVLGLVQGLTEFLPISSTAHLRIVPALLKLVDSQHAWNDPGAAATAIIQLGTLGALLGYFCQDIVRLIRAVLRGLVCGRPFETWEARLGWYCALGTVPIVVCGLMFKDFVKSGARSLWIMASALIVLAAVLYLAEQISSKSRPVTAATWFDAFMMGLAQAVALIPGSSRSGTTITAGLFLGLQREAAARLSFLLSIPALAGSGLYELYEVRHTLTTDPTFGTGLVIATVAALISGYASIAFLLKYLRTHTTYIFIWYRIGLGFLLMVLLWWGKVH